MYSQKRPGLRETTRLSLYAMTALILGVVVYFFVRGPQSVYFLSDWSGFSGWGSSGLKQLTGSLPSFVHIYSFILLTAAALAPWRRLVPVICLLWFAVEALMEIGQHPALAPTLAGLSPDLFTRIAYLETVPSYFLYGTFDPADLAALTAGTLFAYVTILWTRKGRYHDAR